VYFWKAWQPPIKGLILDRDISICWNSLQVLITQSGLWVLCYVVLMCVICHRGMSRRQFVCWTHVSIIKGHHTTVNRIWDRGNVPYTIGQQTRVISLKWVSLRMHVAKKKKEKSMSLVMIWFEWRQNWMWACSCKKEARFKQTKWLEKCSTSHQSEDAFRK